MNPAWAARLPSGEARSAAELRLQSGIEVLELPTELWLRGAVLDEPLDRLLRKLPGAERFAVLPDGQLRPVHSRLPQTRLPDGTWQSIATWAAVDLPPAHLAATPGARVPLVLTRSAREAPANALVTTLAHWTDWGTCAPEIRLAPLRFAVSDTGQALILGTPLPPLPGTRYWERAGVAVPCGWDWSPPLEPEMLSAAWRLRPRDVALVDCSGTWTLIPGENFAMATRSALRASAAGS